MEAEHQSVGRLSLGFSLLRRLAPAAEKQIRVFWVLDEKWMGGAAISTVGA